jgi:DNA-binding transcriptional LysR family regulator
MTTPDLNLLIILDVLLSEGNVTRAANRLHLSPSATSRALARLRKTIGDPLLVRAGRGLVATPRAIELQAQVSRILQETLAVLRPVTTPDLQTTVKTFTLRTSEGFAENFGPSLIERINIEAPGVKLRFVQKLDKDSTQLRDGTIDFETGVVNSAMGPEVRTQALFRDRFVGVVRTGHFLTQGKMTSRKYANAKHIGIERQGLEMGPIDEAMCALNLERRVTTIVGGFSTAVALARASDLVASVPERHTGNLRAGMHTFSLPFATPEFTVSLLWHPRFQADPTHRWLRKIVIGTCAAKS